LAVLTFANRIKEKLDALEKESQPTKFARAFENQVLGSLSKLGARLVFFFDETSVLIDRGIFFKNSNDKGFGYFFHKSDYEHPDFQQTDSQLYKSACVTFSTTFPHNIIGQEGIRIYSFTKG
jgi:hypothetical protein